MKRPILKIIAGAAIGAFYTFALSFFALAGLAAGFNTFFALLYASPFGFGAYFYWPLVGGLLAAGRKRWIGITVLVLLLVHEITVLLSLVLDFSVFTQLSDLFESLPIETTFALLFYLAGQAVAWWLGSRGGPLCPPVLK